MFGSLCVRQNFWIIPKRLVQTFLLWNVSHWSLTFQLFYCHCSLILMWLQACCASLPAVAACVLCREWKYNEEAKCISRSTHVLLLLTRLSLLCKKTEARTLSWFLCICQINVIALEKHGHRLISLCISFSLMDANPHTFCCLGGN